MGAAFIYSVLVLTCVAGLVRPHVALIGYYGFSLLVPNWNWRWSIPEDAGFQKYLAVSCLVGFLVNGLRGNRLRGTPLAACLCFAGYLAVSFASSFSAVDPVLAARYLDLMWKIVLMAVLSVVLIDTPGKLRALMWAALLAQGYNSFRINEDYFRQGYSSLLQGSWAFLDNNTYGLATIPVMGISVALVTYSARLWQRAVAGGVFLLQAHQLMLSETRGGMLGALVLGVGCLWFMPKNRWTLSIVACGAFAVAALAGPSVVKEFASTFKPREQLDDSAAGRFDLWKAGATITLDYPLLGVGPDNGRRFVPQYYPGGLHGNDKALHNVLFDISTGSGVPGAFFYFAFFGLSWVAAFVARRDGRGISEIQAVALAVLCGLPGFFTAGMFASSPLIESPYLLAVLGCCAYLVARSRSADRLDQNPLAGAETTADGEQSTWSTRSATLDPVG